MKKLAVVCNCMLFALLTANSTYAIEAEKHFDEESTEFPSDDSVLAPALEIPPVPANLKDPSPLKAYWELYRLADTKATQDKLEEFVTKNCKVFPWRTFHSASLESGIWGYCNAIWDGNKVALKYQGYLCQNSSTAMRAHEALRKFTIRGIEPCGNASEKAAELRRQGKFKEAAALQRTQKARGDETKTPDRK